MGDVVKGMLFALLVVYILSPIDACPGPIDDLILLVIGLGARKGVTKIED